MFARIAFEALKREWVPPFLLAGMAAESLGQWYRWLDRAFTDALGNRSDARALIRTCARPAFAHRYHALQADFPDLPSPSPAAIECAMTRIYGPKTAKRIGWIYAADAGAPIADALQDRVTRSLKALSRRGRWDELAVHLGEVLIALTNELPKHDFRRGQAFLGRMCFDAGQRYANRMKAQFSLPNTVASAITVLRMGEFIFQVNQEHRSEANLETNAGLIEGSACPWYVRPGWAAMHCGIFGQFQSGISRAFDLNYRLTQTIPRHGGSVCRVDVVPISEPKSRPKESATAV